MDDQQINTDLDLSFCEHGDVQQDQLTGLMTRISAFKSNLNQLRELLQSGADVSLEDNLGYTAIHLALLSPNPRETLSLIGEYKKEIWETEKINRLLDLIKSLEAENPEIDFISIVQQAFAQDLKQF